MGKSKIYNPDVIFFQSVGSFVPGLGITKWEKVQSVII